MHARPKDLGLGKDTDTAYTIELHFHVRVTVGIAEIGQVRTPGGVFCVALYDDGVFVEGVCQSERGLGFLPGVQVVGLFAAEPVWERSPYICLSRTLAKVLSVVYV
jgi:hypothetical protein